VLARVLRRLTTHPGAGRDTWLVSIGARKLSSVVLGPPSTRRLTLAHTLDDFADGLISLSLVGSLFFSVSFDASRERILVYLVLTALPLALVAPVVGPLLDRSRVGHRTVLATTHFARVLLSIGLAGSLGSLGFYPLVFGVLLSRKAYALAKTALLARLATDEVELVSASGHLARAGTIAGGLGTAFGGLLFAIAGVDSLPWAAAIFYAIAGIASLTIPAPGSRAQDFVLPVAAAVPIEVRAASVAVAALHAGSGALTFLLALAIKRGGGEVWVFATALVAAGVATFAGTMVASAVHRRLSPDRVIILCMFVPGLVALAGVLSVGRLGILAIAAGIGLGGSIAARSMDLLYGRVPTDVRSRAISSCELRFQLANVAGASLAVLAAPPLRIGFAVVGAVLVVAAGTYAASRQLSLRLLAGGVISGGRALTGEHALDRDLLEEASYALTRSRPRVAILLAASAARVKDITRDADGAEDVNAVVDELARGDRPGGRSAAQRAIDDTAIR
jgi:predicted MFS family arabinose efflux permease